MAIRTSATNVKTVISGIPAADVLDSYMLTANLLVTERCTTSGYSDERLELIERWLSAHFYAINKRRNKLEKADVVEQRKDDITLDMFLNNTTYGQTAIFLDTAGNLAALVNTLKDIKLPGATIKWLGTDRPWPDAENDGMGEGGD